MGLLVIYGATGHTGRLIARQAGKVNVSAVLCGRDEARTAAVAAGVGLPHRAARVDDPAGLERAFRDAAVVVNVAGPFSRTAQPLVDACLRVGAHYVDVSGEPAVVARLAERHAEARERRTMMLPAAGLDAVATDCLAVHVARRLPAARRLAVAVTPPRSLSAGSVRTLLEHLGPGVVRRSGVLAETPLGADTRTIDFGDGPVSATSVGLVDVVTAFHSTGIPNVTTYVAATPAVRAALAGARLVRALVPPPLRDIWRAAWDVALLGTGPVWSLVGDDPRAHVVAEVDDDRGRRVTARLHTPEPYAFTAEAVVEIARRVLAGDVEPGFQTPGRLFGADFVLGLTDVRREDVV